MPSITSRQVNGELRRAVWPFLKERGFSSRTQRTAWRDSVDCIAVVTFQSFNAYLAEGLRVTSFSFGINLGVRARCSTALPSPREQAGQPRPNESGCDVRRSLWKTIDQDETGRPDIWYVRADGSNLTHVIENALSVLQTIGLTWLSEFESLERMRDFAANEPEGWDSAATGLVNGTWGPGMLDSPRRLQLLADLDRELRSRLAT